MPILAYTLSHHSRVRATGAVGARDRTAIRNHISGGQVGICAGIGDICFGDGNGNGACRHRSGCGGSGRCTGGGSGICGRRCVIAAGTGTQRQCQNKPQNKNGKLFHKNPPVFLISKVVFPLLADLDRKSVPPYGIKILRNYWNLKINH